jgi:single-stranded-DNA-specific exonuclease
MEAGQRPWILKEVADPEAVARLQSDLNQLAAPLARALVARGVSTRDEARHFFRAGIADLHDPMRMKDMDVAVERLLRAIRSRERVVVYGDYDVDGTTATALMTDFLRSHGASVTWFIPDRLRHGYGLCRAGLDEAAAKGATLVIALDCGITAVDEARYARELGMDLVICDHHTPPDELPDAVAVLDAKRRDCPYPFKELCGCGVAFKVAQAVQTALGSPMEALNGYLDLVALATASDIVSLTGENRVLLRAGLELLRTGARPGIRALADEAKIRLSEADTRSILFTLGPRINAAGRLGDAGRAVKLLLADRSEEAVAWARQLERVNRDRQVLDRETLERAVQQAEAAILSGHEKALVLFDPSWHLGVVGIVASRLVERFNRPVVLLAPSGQLAKGSARSLPGINIFDALKACDDLLHGFGGHNYAAGLTIHPDAIESFAARLQGAVADVTVEGALEPPLQIDARLELADIDDRFWAVLRQFAPFGPDNDTPVFATPGLEVQGTPSVVGRDGGHLKFRVRLPGDEASALDVIGFGLAKRLELVRESIAERRTVALAFGVHENVWNGRRTLQLQANDVRFSDTVEL